MGDTIDTSRSRRIAVVRYVAVARVDIAVVSDWP